MLIIKENTTNEEMFKEYPFLQCTKDNPWCYGNSDEINWWNNLDKGWQIAFGNDLLIELKKCLVSYNCLDKFRINQWKEKYGSMRLYFDGNMSAKCYDSIDKIIDKYEDMSYTTCIVCGSKAKYITRGYILPYCEKCVKPAWKVSEIK